MELFKGYKKNKKRQYGFKTLFLIIFLILLFLFLLPIIISFSYNIKHENTKKNIIKHRFYLNKASIETLTNRLELGDKNAFNKLYSYNKFYKNNSEETINFLQGQINNKMFTLKICDLVFLDLLQKFYTPNQELKAISLINKCALQEIPSSQNALSYIYEMGSFAQKDLEKAKFWKKKAYCQDSNYNEHYYNFLKKYSTKDDELEYSLFLTINSNDENSSFHKDLNPQIMQSIQNNYQKILISHCSHNDIKN